MYIGYTGEDRLSSSNLGRFEKSIFEGLAVSREGRDFKRSDLDLIRVFPDRWIPRHIQGLLRTGIEMFEIGDTDAIDFEVDVANTLLDTVAQHDRFVDCAREIGAFDVVMGPARNRHVRQKVEGTPIEAELADLIAGDDIQVHSVPRGPFGEGWDTELHITNNALDPALRVRKILNYIPLGKFND